MATFVQVATRWAAEEAVRLNRPVAIQFSGNKIGPCAAASDAFPAGHGSGTAAVNLMQAHPTLKGWLALSYPPTAACIGMALLLGYKRIVWQQWGRDRSVALDRNAINDVIDGPARVFQADKTNYSDTHANADGFNYGGMAPAPLAAFRPPAGTDDLIMDIPADEQVLDAIALRLAFVIVGMTHGANQYNTTRHAGLQGQNIASVLVDNTYRILGWGLNTNTANTTLHGEVNLIRSYQAASGGAALPAGARLFTTLEPCSMCSGMITRTAGTNRVTVVSGQKDPHLGFTALRAWYPFDGYTERPRQVSHEFTRAVFHPAKTTFHDGPSVTDTRTYLEQTQIQLSEPGRPMQTTRFLENHAFDAILDHAKILSMQAAVWLPQARRATWRRKLVAFALHVAHAIG